MTKNILKENLIKELLQSNLEETQKTYDLMKSYGLENEQYVLNWLDALNAISIK